MLSCIKAMHFVHIQHRLNIPVYIPFSIWSYFITFQNVYGSSKPKIKIILLDLWFNPGQYPGKVHISLIYSLSFSILNLSSYVSLPLYSQRLLKSITPEPSGEQHRDFIVTNAIWPNSDQRKVPL